MVAVGEEERLLAVATAYHLGNYQECILNALSSKFADANAQLQCDVYLYRSYIMINNCSVPLDEIDPNASDVRPALLAVRLMAEFVSTADEKRRASVLAALPALLEKHGTDRLCCETAAQLWSQSGDYEAALRQLRPFNGDLECMSAMAVILILMDRFDLARNVLKEMKAIDGDNVVTQITAAYVHMTQDRDQVRDALYTLQELADKYGPTALLLNGVSACHMRLGEFEEAEKAVHECLKKDSNCPETLVNAISSTTALWRPPEVTSRYVRRMKESFPWHPWTRDLLAKEEEFDQLAAAATTTTTTTTTTAAAAFTDSSRFA